MRIAAARAGCHSAGDMQPTNLVLGTLRLHLHLHLAAVAATYGAICSSVGHVGGGGGRNVAAAFLARGMWLRGSA